MPFLKFKPFLWNDSEAEYRPKLQGFESVLAHCDSVQAFLKDAKLFLRFSRFCFLWSCGYWLLINVADTDIVPSRTVYVALSYSSFKVLSAPECFTGLTSQYQELWTLENCHLSCWSGKTSILSFYPGSLMWSYLVFPTLLQVEGGSSCIQDLYLTILASSVTQRNRRVREGDLHCQIGLLNSEQRNMSSLTSFAQWLEHPRRPPKGLGLDSLARAGPIPCLGLVVCNSCVSHAVMRCCLVLCCTLFRT